MRFSLKLGQRMKIITILHCADTYFGKGTLEVVRCHLNALEEKERGFLLLLLFFLGLIFCFVFQNLSKF